MRHLLFCGLYVTDVSRCLIWMNYEELVPVVISRVSCHQPTDTCCTRPGLLMDLL